MLKKVLHTNLTHKQALFFFNEAKAKSNTRAEIIELAGGKWAVAITFDESGASLPPLEASGDERMVAEPRIDHRNQLGSISERFESNGDPGAVGYDSNGGFSYGAYQIATKTGTMSRFLTFLATKHPEFSTKLEQAGGLQAASAGTKEFKETWKLLAGDSEFFAAQHGFIEASHYKPFETALRSTLRLVLEKRSSTLRDVAWSVAVQHGPANDVFNNALEGKNIETMSDEQIIESVYAERKNMLRYFPSSGPLIHKSLLARFNKELKLALDRLA